MIFFFFFQAEDGIRDYKVTGVQTCALPILPIQKGLISTSLGVSLPSREKTNFPPRMGSISILTRVLGTRSTKGEKPTGPEVGDFLSMAKATAVEKNTHVMKTETVRFIYSSLTTRKPANRPSESHHFDGALARRAQAGFSCSRVADVMSLAD